MFKRPVRTWILNAAAVLSGQHGDVARRSEQSEYSRETVYRHARKVEGRLAAEPDAGAVAELREEDLRLRKEIAGLMRGAESLFRCDRDNTRRFLERFAADCGYVRLGDMSRESGERWLALRADEGMSVRSRNSYRTATLSFGNWCVSAHRLTSNPLKGLPKACEAADPRRKRWSMIEGELTRLLDVARRRPLLEL